MSESPSAPGAVRHLPADSRFVIETDGQESVVEYQRSWQVITFTHTFVPRELRGRGLAEQLVRAALEYARAEKLRVVPACSYVARFIAGHAEYQSLLG